MPYSSLNVTVLVETALAGHPPTCGRVRRSPSGRGIARQRHRGADSSGELFGNAAYLPPQQKVHLERFAVLDQLQRAHSADPDGSVPAQYRPVPRSPLSEEADLNRVCRELPSQQSTKHQFERALLRIPGGPAAGGQSEQFVVVPEPHLETGD